MATAIADQAGDIARRMLEIEAERRDPQPVSWRVTNVRRREFEAYVEHVRAVSPQRKLYDGPPKPEGAVTIEFLISIDFIGVYEANPRAAS
jgi:hypothetical protein